MEVFETQDGRLLVARSTASFGPALLELQEDGPPSECWRLPESAERLLTEKEAAAAVEAAHERELELMREAVHAELVTDLHQRLAQEKLSAAARKVISGVLDVLTP